MLKRLTPGNLVLLIILGTSLIRMFVAANTGLGIGEAYYFKGAMTLEWSYFDQPPLFFWLSHLSMKLLGINAFALRLPAILMFAGTSWFVFDICRRFFDEKSGLYALILLNASLVFTIPIAAWFQPDAPLMFFWMLTTFLLVKLFFNQPEQGWKSYRTLPSTYGLWMLIGGSLGLVTLSKYHSIFLVLGVVLFCITNPKYRHWLWHPGPYLAIFINLVMALPIFIWNYQNHWVSFLFQGARAGADNGVRLYPEFLIRSIIGQALWLAPWIWVPLCIVFYNSFKQRKANLKYSFVFWLAVLPIMFFTMITLWTDTLFHFHWQAPGYLMLFILLGERAANGLRKNYKQTRRWILASVLFTVIFSTALLLHAEKGIFRPFITNEFLDKYFEGRDPSAEGTDYEEIGELFEEKGWLEQDSVFVGSTRWWQAGKIDWALKGELPLIIFHIDPRNHAYFVDPRKLFGFDAVIVTRHDQSVVDYYVAPFFKKISKLENLNIERNGIKELEMGIYYCEDFIRPDSLHPNMPLYRQMDGESPF